MDTIAAISTPYGVGGISVIRLSGPEAIPIAERLTGKHLSKQVHYCPIKDIDDVVVTTYHAPHSFTGEDVIEISCHGSLYIQEEIMRRVIQLGCRTATGGEFTKRAFLNGKLDLTQAEAVADLIASRTRAEKQIALSQLRGGVSKKLKDLREQLLHFASLIELELDFADHEDIEFADRSEIESIVDDIEQRIERLTESFESGNAIKNGINVAIIGATNVGKSTLLNALLGEERAIVSDIHGTTRDTIEDTLIIDGTLYRITDTAGLRDTNDQIESIGIERSKKATEKAQIVIIVKDAQEADKEKEEYEIEPLLVGKKVIRVYNKSDIRHVDNAINISAKNGDIAELKAALSEYRLNTDNTEGVISSTRHYEALVRALEAIRRVKAGLQDNISGEFLSMDIRECTDILGEITGQITSQDVLNNIFSKFCIGK